MTYERSRTKPSISTSAWSQSDISLAGAKPRRPGSGYRARGRLRGSRRHALHRMLVPLAAAMPSLVRSSCALAWERRNKCRNAGEQNAQYQYVQYEPRCNPRQYRYCRILSTGKQVGWDLRLASGPGCREAVSQASGRATCRFATPTKNAPALSARALFRVCRRPSSPADRQLLTPGFPATWRHPARIEFAPGIMDVPTQLTALFGRQPVAPAGRLRIARQQ